MSYITGEKLVLGYEGVPVTEPIDFKVDNRLLATAT